MRVPTRILRRSAIAAASVGSIAMAAAPAATAAPPSKVSFFTEGTGTASWEKDSPGDKVIALTVADATSYAGVELEGAPATLPADEPSFAFSSSVSGDSGGSPRLVVRWADGGTSALRPLTWTADTWSTVTGSLWEDNTGCTEGSYNLSYAQVQTCHAGDTIAAVYVVTDSGWVTNPYTHSIDDIVFGDITVSEPGGGNKK